MYYIQLCLTIFLTVKIIQCHGDFEGKFIKKSSSLNKAFPYPIKSYLPSKPTKKNAKINNLNFSKFLVDSKSNKAIQLNTYDKKEVIKNAKRKRPVSLSIETTKGIDVLLGQDDKKKQLSNMPNSGKNNQDLQFIVFGTKWCGTGDIAKSKRDIGFFHLSDSCCREHDFCPQTIKAKESQFGLINTGSFTRSHCDCDHKFYECLKNANTLLSHQIGLVYFNVLGPECFVEDEPHVCEHEFKGRCMRYGKERNQTKIYQWLDNKWYF